jgi:hypothetical protein
MLKEDTIDFKHGTYSFTITKLNKITLEKPRKQLTPTNHHKVGRACV